MASFCTFLEARKTLKASDPVVSEGEYRQLECSEVMRRKMQMWRLQPGHTGPIWHNNTLKLNKKLSQEMT